MPIIENPINNLNYACDYCGKPIHLKPYIIKKYKHNCCCRSCSSKLKSITFKGENNHQFGLKGSLNSSYNFKTKKIKNGYFFIRKWEHPFKDEDGWVREHRLIAEKYLLNNENSVIVNEERYLNPDYEVHHIDENPLNNDIENLIIVTKSEHRIIHNFLKPRKRDLNTGRFISDDNTDMEEYLNES